MLSSNPLDAAGSVLHIQQLFTPEQTDKIISEGLKWEKRPAATYNALETSNHDHAIRKGHVYSQPSNDMFNAWFRPILDQAIVHYLRKTYPIHIDFRKVEIQMADYQDVGDHFRPHRDSYIEQAPGEPTRKLSMSVELSEPDEYDGANVSFIDGQQNKFSPIGLKGDAYVFPSWYKHGVRPLVTGHRRALIAWYYGPFWA